MYEEYDFNSEMDEDESLAEDERNEDEQELEGEKGHEHKGRLRAISCFYRSTIDENGEKDDQELAQFEGEMKEDGEHHVDHMP